MPPPGGFLGNKDMMDELGVVVPHSSARTTWAARGRGATASAGPLGRGRHGATSCAG
ncbi:MAG: hypothetical protein ACLTDR_10930 [Adlercreutzia equolifaciens]